MFTNENILASGVDQNKDPFELADFNPDFLQAMATLAFSTIPTWGAGGNDGSFFDGDLRGSGGTTFYRVREGIERFMITDINNPAASAKAQSDVWIMHDELESDLTANFNHIPGGVNVLYMDGHVAFVRYPTQTPASRAWMTFSSI